MNITSAKYDSDSITGEQKVSIQATIDSVKLSVPLDPTNTHYAEIMRQVDAGELTIEPADE